MSRTSFQIAAAVTVAGLFGSTNIALSQGVPIIDSAGLKEELAILLQRKTDLTAQDEKRSRRDQLLALDDQIIAELDKIITAAQVSHKPARAMIDDLEAGSGDAASAADKVYDPDDSNPAVDKTFGDAAVTVEKVIIQGAKATYNHPGVAIAGLSLSQWRALLQAVIWQESRFNPFIGSPAGAWGLTQLMPGTAAEVGVAADFRTNPYSQVVGGATYLARMLKRENGSIVRALAAYNAGPGNVDKYNGVPPFKETQHYVQVIPQKYNEYLGKIGGIDALGTIDPTLASGANFAIAADGALNYAAYSAEISEIAKRVKSAIQKIRATENPAEAWVLNTYVRGEMARIIALQARMLSVQTRMVSADGLQQAAAEASERRYMQFSNP